MESKRDRFRRLADGRGTRLQREIKLLSSLADDTLYEFDQTDVERLFGPLEKTLNEVKSKFQTDESGDANDR